jgi:hypothetical protein
MFRLILYSCYAWTLELIVWDGVDRNQFPLWASSSFAAILSLITCRFRQEKWPVVIVDFDKGGTLGFLPKMNVITPKILLQTTNR